MVKKRKINNCLQCGNEIRIWRRFCSKSCSAKFKSCNKCLISKNDLIELYINQRMEISKICELKHISSVSVFRYIKKYDIKYRGDFIDYTNVRFGNIICLEPIFPEQKSGKHVKWRCKCDCGNEFITISTCITNRKHMLCKLCVSKRRRDNNEFKNYFYNSIKRSAINRNLDFLVSKDYLYSLFLLQNRKCKLSNVDIKFAETCKNALYNRGNTASLDRIDSSKGYIDGNVQWVHKDVNLMKSTHSNEEFIAWCKLISENN